MPTVKLADGTEIDALTGQVVGEQPDPEADDDEVPFNYVEVPTHHDAQRQVTAVRRTLNDLPEPPEKMNAIALIAMYHMYGLTDSEISIVTGVAPEQVGLIKMREGFTAMIDAVAKSVVESDATDVRTMLAQASKGAASRVIAHVNSRDAAVSMAAAKDVLDRSGHRAADIVEHRHKVEGGLTIEYVKKADGDDVPLIDVTPVDD